MADLPQPVPASPPIVRPEDRPYPGTIRLSVDATDIQRAIFHVHEVIPVASPGPMTLLYPKWIPGYHSPNAPIELLAGLEITAAGERLNWRRDPVEVNAFHIDVPAGVEAIEARFQYLTPTSKSQGDVVVAPEMLILRWNAALLYPAGYFSRRIAVAPSVTLPEDWSHACALSEADREGPVGHFETVALDVLVDSPLVAGRWSKRFELDANGPVSLALFADREDRLAAPDEALEALRNLVAQADRLFRSRHFDHFDFMLALSGELEQVSVEHHRSFEMVAEPDLFSAWDAHAPRRDVLGHEYVHSWNGKFRRGADSWTPTFERPIRNSLMWVYEGQTQYWGQVLAARSGLWTTQQALEALAVTAAVYSTRPGSRWRPMSDTTRDPIIAERQPMPWPSWQRSEDYYSEGQLVWLDVDTLIRELSGDERSLDDFARAFFGVADGRMTTLTYEFEDVVRTLESIAPHDWAGFLTHRLDSLDHGTTLHGLERGGYRLIYRKTPSDFASRSDALDGLTSLRFSVGLVVSTDGLLQEVIWESPAFRAGLVAGGRLLAVNGRAYSPDELMQAIAGAEEGGEIEVIMERAQHRQCLTIEYSGGLRFPHLEPIEGARRRLDEIYAPL